jgi:hypothetical protein
MQKIILRLNYYLFWAPYSKLERISPLTPLISRIYSMRLYLNFLINVAILSLITYDILLVALHCLHNQTKLVVTYLKILSNIILKSSAKNCINCVFAIFHSSFSNFDK